MSDASVGADQLLHGTCVALGRVCALIRGPSGSGKSDLALRFLSSSNVGSAPRRLIADDQVHVTRDDARLFACAPASIAGLIEVRGVGVVSMPSAASAALVLLADCVTPAEVPRLPPKPLPSELVLGLPVARIALAPFEASAPDKLALALASLGQT